MLEYIYVVLSGYFAPSCAVAFRSRQAARSPGSAVAKLARNWAPPQVGLWLKCWIPGKQKAFAIWQVQNGGQVQSLCTFDLEYHKQIAALRWTCKWHAR